MYMITQLNEFVKKTLEQKINKKIQYQGFRNKIANLIGGDNFETMKGGYIEYGTIDVPKVNMFDDSAFIQSDKNFNSAGTGLLANNRNDVYETITKNKFRFVMVDPDKNTNINYAVANYRNAKYADILLSEEFINETLEQNKLCIELNRLNDCLFGKDFIAENTTQHYNGIKDIINTCKQDTPITSISQIELSGYSQKYIDLTSDASDLENFANLNTIFEYASKNVLTNFSFGTNQTIKYLTENIENAKILCWPSFLEKVKAKNLQFYKELTDLYEQGKLLVLPKTFAKCGFVSGELAATTGEIQNTTSTAEGFINLDDDEVLIYEPSQFIKKTYNGIETHTDLTTPNNITKSVISTEIHAFDYNPSGIAIVVKLPKMIDLTDSIQP